MKKKIDVKALKTVRGGTLGLLFGGGCSPCGGGHGGGKSGKGC